MQRGEGGVTVVLTAGGEKDGSRSISAADYANAVGSRFKMVSAAEAVGPARFVGGGAVNNRKCVVGKVRREGICYFRIVDRKLRF